MTSAHSSLSPCGEILRDYDRDRFLTSLFAPAKEREALFALYAFNHEIAKTRELISETVMGLIRLTWWREAIEEIYAGKPARAHEVVEPLAKAIRDYDLPQDKFEALIYGREFDLEDVLPSNMTGLQNYAQFTAMPLTELANMILSGQPHSDMAAPVAQIIALTGILRAVPFHARQHRCYLPEDLLRAEGLSPQDIYNGKSPERLKPVAKAITAQINPHFEDVEVKSALRPVLLQVSRARQYIRQLEKQDYDVFDPAFQGEPPFSVLRLIWNYTFHRI
ncbi:MAG: phytoene/squalene synthase family protein [Pseudomonadota bacterium]